MTDDTAPPPDPARSAMSKVSPNPRAACAMAKAKYVDASTSADGGRLLPNDCAKV